MKKQGVFAHKQMAVRIEEISKHNETQNENNDIDTCCCPFPR